MASSDSDMDTKRAWKGVEPRRKKDLKKEMNKGKEACSSTGNYVYLYGVPQASPRTIREWLRPMSPARVAKAPGKHSEFILDFKTQSEAEQCFGKQSPLHDTAPNMELYRKGGKPKRSSSEPPNRKGPKKRSPDSAEPHREAKVPKKDKPKHAKSEMEQFREEWQARQKEQEEEWERKRVKFVKEQEERAEKRMNSLEDLLKNVLQGMKKSVTEVTEKNPDSHLGEPDVKDTVKTQEESMGKVEKEGKQMRCVSEDEEIAHSQSDAKSQKIAATDLAGKQPMSEDASMEEQNPAAKIEAPKKYAEPAAVIDVTEGKSTEEELPTED